MELIKVNEDSRRTIHAVNGLLSDNKEFTFINLKKGKAIGGCSHEEDEYYTIVKGNVTVIIDDYKIDCYPGDSGIFRAGVPHGFIANEDAIISEWGISAVEKQKDKKDQKLREYLDSINDTSI